MVKLKEFDLVTCPLEGANLIEASAGTGKTYTITGLMLRLILEKRISIDEILVVTFTEAATNELKDRIRKKLKETSESLAGGDISDAFLLQLLKNHHHPDAAISQLNRAIIDFDLASVFTIHGFCRKALMDNAFASGVMPDTALEKDQTGLSTEIVHDFWRKHFYQTSPLFYTYAKAHHLMAGFQAMTNINPENPYLRIIPQAGLPDCSEVENELHRRFDQVRRVWPGAKSEIEEILTTSPALNRTQYRRNSIPGLIQSMDIYLSGDLLDGDPGSFLDKFTAGRVSEATKKNCSPPSHPFLALVEDFKAAQERLQEAYQARLLGLKVEFCHYLGTEMNTRKLKKNILFFDDLLIKLERALNGPGGDRLAEILRGRYQAALIDEFQDTDAVQYAIFKKIFEPAGRMLFLIGDPKQAIYSFRGADIFTYMNAA
ncbi:MAG: UvrD-helicase domain-containing protein, partial [Deltaproteobacteria bacterium]|nr:UvrD-helicase domain-containing protein [Deltaproteobacteria bacterium]